VYAFRAELEAWREQRTQRPAVYQSIAPIQDLQPRNRKGLWVITALLGAASLLLVFWALPVRRTDPIPVPITSYPGNELDPAFSPDGLQIAFTWDGDRQDNYDIYVRPLGEDRPVRLTSDPAVEFGSAWSPDGRSIAFLRLKAGNSIEVMVIPASGGLARVLTEFFYDPHTFLKFRTRFLAWRPNSRQLAVAGRDSASEPHALWIVDDDGNKRRLTTPPAAYSLGDLSPAYAPDGRMLLFTRGNTRFTSELHLVPLADDGMPAGDPKLLTPGTVSANTPVWVGDQQIVFHQFFGGGLWTVSLPGGRPAPLGFARWWAELPAFSPRGQRLAYAAGGQEFHIWTRDLTVPDRSRRAVASTHMEMAPAISPDGDRLAFTSTRSGNHEVWVSGIEGQNPVRLTALEGRASGEARWSPDGRWTRLLAPRCDIRNRWHAPLRLRPAHPRCG
jgi:Tol biopolymer transport system component